MKGRVGILGAATAALIVAGFAGGALAADPWGVWLNGRSDAHVKLYPCDDGELCGEIVWLKRSLGQDGEPRRDVHNEDEDLRGRPLLGIQVLWGMEDEGDGEWEDGDIYNARDGETYDGEIEVIDAKTLEVSGCVFFICKTETWTRVE